MAVTHRSLTRRGCLMVTQVTKLGNRYFQGRSSSPTISGARVSLQFSWVFPHGHHTAASTAGPRAGGSGTRRQGSRAAPRLVPLSITGGELSAPSDDFPFISLAKLGHMTISVMEVGKVSDFLGFTAGKSQGERGWKPPWWAAAVLAAPACTRDKLPESSLVAQAHFLTLTSELLVVPPLLPLMTQPGSQGVSPA